MTKVLKPYSKKEDNLILSNVNKSPDNLAKSFEVSAKEILDKFKISRSPKGISQRYYHIRRTSNKVLELKGKNTVRKNTKNIPRSLKKDIVDNTLLDTLVKSLTTKEKIKLIIKLVFFVVFVFYCMVY